MKEFLQCCFVSMLVGATVGAVLVTKNKQIQECVQKGTNMVEDKIDDIKQSMQKAKKSIK